MKPDVNPFLSHEQENDFPLYGMMELENVLVCVKFS